MENENAKSIQAEVAKRIHECLKGLGFDAETKVSEHEAIVFARKHIQGDCIRVVTHISDREPKTAGSGSINNDIARTRLALAAIRPSLAAQAATRFVPGKESAPEECK